MTSSAKAKGNSWELDLCKFLKEHFGGNWQRVPNSGAFTGGKNNFRKQTLTEKQTRMFKGDVIPDDSMPKIVLECKFYKEFPFHLLVREEVKQLDMWIAQTMDAADPGDTWFLCIKINRKSTYIVCERSVAAQMTLRNYVTYKNYIFTDLETFMIENKDQIKKICA